MNIYWEVENNRTHCLKRLILWQPWYVRVARWFRQAFTTCVTL